MKNYLTPLLLVLIVSGALLTRVLADCGDTQTERAVETDSFTCGIATSTITKTVHWTVYWLDGYSRNVDVTDTGQLFQGNLLLQCSPSCWPSFEAPYFVQGETAYWYQKTYTSTVDTDGVCHTASGVTSDHRQGHTCGTTPGHCGGELDYSSYSSGCATGFTDLGGYCGRSYAFQGRCNEPSGYDPDSCTCPDGTSTSPIIIDVDHSGFSMTDAAGGAVFNILNDGVPLQLSWTAVNSTNAFLVLDRDGNGTIDNGTELFGNLTPQPQSPGPNGFLALAVYDKPANGGNNNGRIDQSDAIFSRLRLWQDLNHNGISEASELHALPQLGVQAIDLDYKVSRRTDQYGNKFRYRSKVYDLGGAHTGRWAWDVFLLVK